MSGEVIVRQAGPAMSLQDAGRPGYRAQGITRGGAADPLALQEAAVLLRQSPDLAAIEMNGNGGRFEATQDTAVALTGAEMAATLDGAPLAPNACHAWPRGATLAIGGARAGTYGYLSVAGGFDGDPVMGSRAAHLTAEIGRLLETGDRLPFGNASGSPRCGWQLRPDSRLAGGTVRIVASMQTGAFTKEMRNRFSETRFVRDARANRQGVRLSHDGEGFAAADGLGIVSEVIVPGDIQITGDGAPYVLMCECQTTGGYPRIGTVIPADLPLVAQAPAGALIRFEFMSLEEAIAIERRARAALKALPDRLHPLVRDPHDIPDLLGYQLVGGVVSATADPYSD
ncbi:biotin-dependent carboxyltransferase family protein [Sulfitobacter sp. D35]|uniref:5-oxoprolinase subunit C family protein n=1 Tax=Sulfitobacter sp. D35 TaxID=3083252 RepID=UPI00296F670C|nr:biotin-dependent carboxyltransferase family protein [Sulfitobacter sp. D35]MDW4498955.1 biotin-dependent carboxyltransferase family protein [Sulfitobacter sp. D35]